MRIKELDAFRGIAALSVVLYHYTTVYHDNFDVPSLFYVQYGWLGVPLFFILSGFVITLTIQRCKNPLEFLLKRFIRLYPTYWISLSITLLVIYISNSQGIHDMFSNTTTNILFNFTMFQELVYIDHVDASYWSLLPELLFYLLIAFLFWIKKVNNLLLYNSILIGICIIHYFFPLPIVGRILDLHYVLLFMIGICFYNIYANYKKVKQYIHFLIVINLILGIFLYGIIRPHLDFTVILITFPMIVLLFYGFVYQKFAVLGTIKSLLFLGIISYPLYLIHQIVGFIFMLFFDQYLTRELSIFSAVSLSIILATIITFYLEPPLKRATKKIIFK